jgi:hypothetical protein
MVDGCHVLKGNRMIKPLVAVLGDGGGRWWGESNNVRLLGIVTMNSP